MKGEKRKAQSVKSSNPQPVESRRVGRRSQLIGTTSNQQRATSTAQPDRAFIALGANLGDRNEALLQARKKLFSATTVQLVAASSVYETAPVGKTDQPAFLNQVIEARTTLTPDELLARLLQVEHELGRVRNERWGPRNIDLDLLAFGNRQDKTDRLVLPHPELHRRRFVLQPWAEIAPEFIVPGFSATVEKLLENCGDNNRVQKLDSQLSSFSLPIGSSFTKEHTVILE